MVRVLLLQKLRERERSKEGREGNIREAEKEKNIGKNKDSGKEGIKDRITKILDDLIKRINKKKEGNLKLYL